ncbi:MAG TPA: TadE family protein [Candidatus Acidoferrales bacterium]|nr:TadE family protein [Candidatus Acidoferrales bacterium]
MDVVTRAVARGQAIVETAVFLPLALLVLFAVIWAAQYGVLSERVESAVRYSGLISNQINPFVEYSYYVLYNSLGSSSPNSPVPSQTCNAPTTDALTNSNTYPGPSMGPFWTATAAPPVTQCVYTNSQSVVFSTGMNQNAIALSNSTTVQAQLTVPAYLSSALGFSSSIIGPGALPIARTANFMKPADLKTILSCHNTLQAALAGSLAPTPLTSAPPTTTTPMPEPLPTQSSVPYTC